MKNEAFLEAIDAEILGELASRRDALRRAGKMSTNLLLGSVPVAFAALAKSAFAQGGLPQEVIGVLNFALTLEHLENEFYVQGLAAPNLIPAVDRPIFQTIQDHEAAHVAALRQVLGAQAVEKPNFDFSAGGVFAPFQNYVQFKLLSQAFEDTGVRAYKGQAPKLLDNDQLLTVALTIHSVEARHAARVRRLNGISGWIPLNQPGIPAAAAPVYAGEEQTTQLGVNVPAVSGLSAQIVSEAFDEPLTMEQVLQIARPFIRG